MFRFKATYSCSTHTAPSQATFGLLLTQAHFSMWTGAIADQTTIPTFSGCCTVPPESQTLWLVFVQINTNFTKAIAGISCLLLLFDGDGNNW